MVIDQFALARGLDTGDEIDLNIKGESIGLLYLQSFRALNMYT